MSKNRYDVGVYGVWYGCNYGSIATYYGLNKVLEDLGYSVLMIDKPDLGNPKDFEKGNTHSRRFAEEHYDISSTYKLEELKGLNELCDTFIIGSDQVWNYGISKNFGKSNYLDFANDDKKKIAYAASFGHGIDFAPAKERRKISKLMRRLDAISIREEEGVELARKVYGVKAEHVVDSVFLANKEVYENLAKKARIEKEKPYIVTYILDPTEDKRNALLHVSDKLGFPLVNILDGTPKTWRKNQEKLGLKAEKNVCVEEWLYLIKNSEFVITDSFHGAAFAAIFGKTFIPIVNKERGFSRFKSLVDTLGIPERLVKDPKEIIDNSLHLEPMDVDYVRLVIESHKVYSREWLKKSLETPKVDLPSVFVPLLSVEQKLEEAKCTGCSACVNSCKEKALVLKQDEWGYYRRKVIDEKCVDCSHCTKICPVLELPANANSQKPHCYAMVTSDESVLESSSSGGVFSALANEMFSENGYVVGAAWAKDFSVKHIMIDSISDLAKLQKSKYLQSYLGGVFSSVKEKLEEDNKVLFSGTPCQVAGLKAYLGKEYENLLLVDILCAYAPSSMFFQMYLGDAFPEGIQEYEFRYKGRGWNCATVKVVTKSGDVLIRQGEKDDDYQRVYHNHTMCSHHCENCKFQKLPRFGDLTLGDFWGIEHRDHSIDTKQGVSVVLCNNKRGEKFLNEMPKEALAIRKEVPLKWLGKNGYAINDSKNYSSPKRDLFYKAIKTKPFSKAVDYALKPNHGIYDKRYKIGNTPLQYNISFLKFKFDNSVWEEHNINGATTLFVKEGMSAPRRFAILPLSKPLIKGESYIFDVKFKAKTESEVLNFHIKDSGSELYQVIHSHFVPKKEAPLGWVECSIQFRPDSNIYDEFMIGASQIRGVDNYIAFEYIHIGGE